MLPIPTRSAIAAFLGAAVVLGIGLAMRSAPTIVFAGSGFVGLGWALAATMPVGRRLRRQRLEFAWWLDHGSGVASGAVVSRSPFVVRCYVRHRGRDGLDVSALQPLLPPSVQLREPPGPVRLEGEARTEFVLHLLAPAAGRVVLHGLAVRLRGPLGFFDTPLYFPNPLVVKVLPRAAAGRGRAAPSLRHASIARSGRTIVRHRGGGTELHELRELVPGDPFKSIAWKASARRGRLMVKEVEQEVQETRWLILDVGGSMRGGPVGARKLDFAIEAAAAEAHQALEGGDRVGLVTFDGRLVAHVPAGEGKAQRIRVYDALLGSTELVDEDLTDIDDAGLAAVVARYVRQQDGVDYMRGRGPIDLAGLTAHVKRALSESESQSQSKTRTVQAHSPVSRWLRRFCQARGLPLPHRAEPPDHAKTLALAEALKRVGGRTRSPASILICTDFDGITDPEPLIATLKLVRAHGHRVMFLLPDGRSFGPRAGADPALEKDLLRIYGRNEERRLRDARTLLGRMGIPARIATADMAPGWAAMRVRTRAA